ncbi:hypothetical protein MKW98_019894 [Papaver atlanticum]|uniref:Uncharacterized protein n=1 Tax=Papaver atlanticum TaxID=357466 RepID=A0AAD4X5Y9_9MAGN|nr:hypothetical protein MKW98_019894 [Papaver atlanticum]
MLMRSSLMLLKNLFLDLLGDIFSFMKQSQIQKLRFRRWSWLVDMKESCSQVVFFSRLWVPAEISQLKNDKRAAQSRLWVPAEILQLKNDKYPELIVISVVNRNYIRGQDTYRRRSGLGNQLR